MRSLSFVLSACFMIGSFTLGGCGDDADDQTASPDAGTSDSQMSADSENVTPVNLTFSSEDDGSASPAVALRLDTIKGDQAWLEVVGRGISQLQGLAFRLTYDPDALQVDQTEAGPGWPASTSVARFAARPEGELWAGIGHKGKGSLNAQDTVVLARLKVKLLANGALAFRDLHNMVLDPEGQAVKVSWLGGTFEADSL